MSFKKGFGVLIAVGIVTVIGIELWTVSTMLWTELVEGSSGENPHSSADVSNSRTFSLGSTEGRFEKFRLQAGEKDWTFHLRLQLKSLTSDDVRVKIKKLRIGENTTYLIDRTINFRKNRKYTISLSQRIKPGTSPDALLLEVEESGRSRSDWISLPKIPVRAVN